MIGGGHNGTIDNDNGSIGDHEILVQLVAMMILLQLVVAIIIMTMVQLVVMKYWCNCW